MNNDLISRSALKKEIASLVVNGESRIYEVMPRDGGEWIDGIASAYREIDNAPTVTHSLNLKNITEDDVEKFKMIWQRANSKGLLVISEDRPQGEWLDEKFVAFHLTCNQCGCHIRRQKNEVFEGDFDYNFCPNCGADMRGEDNE